MMRGTAVESAQMNVGFCRLREALEEILHQFDLEIADTFCRDLRIHDAVRPSAKIHGGSSECFVHGHQEVARAQNAALGAECFLHRLAESNSHIFHRVVLVHVKIAARVRVHPDSASSGYPSRLSCDESLLCVAW